MPFSKKQQPLLLIFFSVLLYFNFAYFLERTAFNQLVFLWFSLFGCFYLLMKNREISFANLAGIAIIFRLIFLFATPNLSQDFYRFIWDGRMILEGLNPYLSLPETYIQQGNFPITQAKELYAGMGELNGSHYTNYPPLNQLCFLLAALFSNENILGAVVVFRILIILADVGILYFGKRLLESINLPVKNIFWYILNPFIIIEMTGNLHFEPVMLFFFIWGLYKIYQQKWIWGAILIACSVSVKLIPLLFLPLFFQWFTKERNIIVSEVNRTKVHKETILLKLFNNAISNFRLKGLFQLIAFYAIILITTIVLFLPFYSSTLIENYSSSVGLWFRNFEFNASFYYIFREIGYLFRGYNEIAIIGKITPVLTISFLIILTFFRKNSSIIQLCTAFLFGICFYYFTATTVHPWYLATPIIVSVFTKYRFPIVWSLVVILSYQAYANTIWKENLWFVSFEYSIVYGYLIYELMKNSKQKIHI